MTSSAHARAITKAPFVHCADEHRRRLENRVISPDNSYRSYILRMCEDPAAQVYFVWCNVLYSSARLAAATSAMSAIEALGVSVAGHRAFIA